MLNIKGLDHLNISVKSLTQTVNWYEDLFGFEVKETGLSSEGNPYKIIGKSGVFYMALYEVPKINKDKIEHSPIKHIGFALDHFEESVEILKKKGIALSYGGIVNYENSKSVYITDPNGIEIELSSRFGGGLN